MKQAFFVLVALILILFSLHAFTQETPYKEGEVLVRYLSSVSEENQLQMLSQIGGEVKDQDFLVPNLKLIKLEAGQTVEEAIKQFEQMPGVIYAAPNHYVSIIGGIFPPRPEPDPDPTPNPFNDPLFDRSYGISKIGSPKAWTEFTTGNRSVLVAVIDTGVDYTHEDLAANMWKNPKEIEDNAIDDDNNGFIDDIYGWNFVGNNNNPFDDNRHGTHVSGTIGALAGNGLGTIGVSPKVSIMACKFLSKDGWGTLDAAMKAITYAVANGAKVLNNSWGGGGFSQPLLDTIKAAERSGVLFVAAAGNSNNDNDKNPMYPASYDAPNIVSVAATDTVDQKAFFSNFGKTTVDLGAPGVGVFSSLPNNLYGNLSGTSMATPHVSGLAAKLWQGSASATRTYLHELAMLNDLDAAGDDPAAGFGLPVAP